MALRALARAFARRERDDSRVTGTEADARETAAADARERSRARAEGGRDSSASARTLARVGSARESGGRRLERAGSARESGGRGARTKSVSFAPAIATTIVDGREETSGSAGGWVGDGADVAREEGGVGGAAAAAAGPRPPPRGAFDASRTILSEDIFGVDAVTARDGRPRARG